MNLDPFYYLDSNGNIDYAQYIKETVPYIRDFIEVLKDESASTYYSTTQKKTVDVEELNKVLFKLVDVIYEKY